MKIYTKINYKWLDGQLVKTSSKSFEYEGDLTLCGGGGGGGGKGGGGGGSGLPKISVGGTTGDLLDAGKTNLNTAADAGAAARDELIDEFIAEPAEEVLTETAETGHELIEGAVGSDGEGDPEYASSSGIGSLQGNNAALSINKKTEGAPGAFTRGSLRVRKPPKAVNV